MLFKYLKLINFPNPKIETCGEISQQFLEIHIESLWDAIDYVKKLPYGRTIDRANYKTVLEGQCGACSTKHALIAALAYELSIPIDLTLGIFFLTPKNMPDLIPILNLYQLEMIPEAHCYLKYNNDTLDISFPHSNEFSFNALLAQEINIQPDQIGSFKVQKHQDFIKYWLKGFPHLSFEKVWKAREEWIKKLSEDT